MLTDIGANLLANVLVNRTSIPATLYVALFTDSPVPTDNGTTVADLEPSGGGYVRKSISMSSSAWVAATDGATSNSAALSYGMTSADWGTVSHYGMLTAATAGDLLWYGPLLEPAVVPSGIAFEIGVGGIYLQVGNS